MGQYTGTVYYSSLPHLSLTKYIRITFVPHKCDEKKMSSTTFRTVPQTDRITTFTEFQLPLAVDLSELKLYGESELSVKWVAILDPLRNARGWKQGSWGRIVERPETVLLVSGTYTRSTAFFSHHSLLPLEWDSREALDDFKQSSEYEIYLKGISELGDPVSCDVVFPGLGVARNSQEYRPSITKIYFPHPVTQEKRDVASHVSSIFTPAIVHACHFGSSDESTSSIEERSEKRAKRFKGYHSGTSKGWKMQSEVVGGVEMDVLVWVYWWFSAETEEMGKKGRDAQFHRPPGENMSNFQIWEQKMRDVGAVDLVEEHWECSFICPTWEKIQAETKASLARNVNAKPLTFDQVFGSMQ